MSSSNCWFLLAALVHHGNPDVTEDPTSVDAGKTCNYIRSASIKDSCDNSTWTNGGVDACGKSNTDEERPDGLFVRSSEGKALKK